MVPNIAMRNYRGQPRDKAEDIQVNSGQGRELDLAIIYF